MPLAISFARDTLWEGHRSTHIFRLKRSGGNFLLPLPARVEHRRRVAPLRPVGGRHALLLQLDVVAAEEVVEADVDIRVLVQLVLRRASPPSE